jgi:hypothetical protein
MVQVAYLVTLTHAQKSQAGGELDHAEFGKWPSQDLRGLDSWRECSGGCRRFDLACEKLLCS